MALSMAAGRNHNSCLFKQIPVEHNGTITRSAYEIVIHWIAQSRCLPPNRYCQFLPYSCCPTQQAPPGSISMATIGHSPANLRAKTRHEHAR
eukprot:scaffold439300_cov36-Prasinocladus_malaysianus.AAC.1